MFTPRRVLVAGATGLIGSRVVAALAAGGDTVYGLSANERDANVVAALGATPVAADPLDCAPVYAAVAELRPEIVIDHLSAVPETPLSPRERPAHEAVGRRGDCTANLAAAAEEHGVQRLVVQSSACLYRPQGPAIVDEAAPLDTDASGAWGEGVSALAATEQAVLSGRNYVGVVLRYGRLYGPGTGVWDDGLAAELARRRRLPIVGRGDGLQSFLHLDDAAGATLAALDGGSGIYNVVDDRPLPAREWIPAFARALAAPPPRRMSPWFARLVGGAETVRLLSGQRGADNARIRNELSWRPEYSDFYAGLAGLRQPAPPASPTSSAARGKPQ